MPIPIWELMMSLVIFICPENQYLSKYCEAFYNHVNFVYLKQKTSTYGGSLGVPSPSRRKVALARLPKKKNHPDKTHMKASDPTLERIYKKVITSDCYDFAYYPIVDAELNMAELIIFITDNKKPKPMPKYIVNKKAATIIWKFSNVKQVSEEKYTLIEKLIRKKLKT